MSVFFCKMEIFAKSLKSIKCKKAEVSISEQMVCWMDKTSEVLQKTKQNHDTFPTLVQKHESKV